MPEEELPRSFPQPSRNYDGPLLDPMLVEEDFAETAGIVRRFALRNQGFTERELLGHLAANGVSLYGTQGEWDALFGEMQEHIVGDGAERRPPVRITWTVRLLGERAVYTMVQKPAAGELPADTATVEPVAPKAPPETVADTEPDEIQVFVGAVRRILEAADSGMLRRKDMAAAVSAGMRVGADEIDRLLSHALMSGRLAKVRTQGVTFISLPAEQPAESPAILEPEAAADRLDAEAQLTELETYMQVVSYVMRSLTALRDVSMGLPYDKMWRRSSLEDAMDFEDFKRFVRRMEGDGLVAIEKDAKLSTRTGHSKVIRGSKVFVADKHVRSSWKVNAKENLHDMYEKALEALLEEE